MIYCRCLLFLSEQVYSAYCLDGTQNLSVLAFNHRFDAYNVSVKFLWYEEHMQGGIVQ